MNQERKCAKCGTMKIFDLFHKDASAKGGIRYTCKECCAKDNALRVLKNPNKSRAMCRRWSKNNPQKKKDIFAKWYKANPERVKLNHLKSARKGHLRRKYGITEEDYKGMIEIQGNRCLICYKTMIEPNVDHCHKTNLVRGLLCSQCNNGLGNFKDNTESLLNAVWHIMKYNNQPHLNKEIDAVINKINLIRS